MTEDEGCCHDHPTQFDVEDGQVVRTVAQEVERNAARARAFAYGLLTVGVMALVLLAGAALYQGAQIRTLVQDAVVRAEAERIDQEVTGDLVACVFGKLDLHQQQADEVFREFARRNNFDLPGVPLDPPTIDRDEIEAACDRADMAFQREN